MRYVQHTERVGELLGPVDWTYDFLSHFKCYCTDDAGKRLLMEQRLDWLRQMEASVKDNDGMQATTYGGWPRCAWGRVLAVGMYDGWPYWKPVPSVLIQTWMGSEWACFASVTDIRAQPAQGGAE